MFILPEIRRASRGCNDVKTVLESFSLAHEMTMALKDEPFPYAVTVNYAPQVIDDELYLIFHGARAGRKFELMKRDPHVAFTITLRSQIYMSEDAHSTNFFKSISGDGVIEFLEGEDSLNALMVLMRHHGSVSDDAKLREYLLPSLKATQSFMLKVRMAGLKEIPVRA